MEKEYIMIKIGKTVEWLKQKVEETGTRGLLVGVSGGVDSAVVAFLIKQAFSDNSLGVILPCESSEEDIEDAYKVVEACGINSVSLDLTHIHKQLTDMVFSEVQKKPDMSGQDSRRISEANLKARLRMSSLYAIANALNYLVVGTDNAAELYIGYFTKYGDGGVDLLPMAHLTKREVRAWADLLGVPRTVIQKPPTAGLWEGQTDEGEMGTTYNMIDDHLEGKDIPEKDMRIIQNMHRRSEHKRHSPQAPPSSWY